MAKKSIKKNYVYNLMFQVLVIILPLITTPYISRILGAEAIGIYSYTVSVVTYFILFGSLGVSMYGQREIAYVQDNCYERSKKFYEILIMRFITLGTSLIIFYICFCRSGQYVQYYRILIIELVANSIDISWFFHGLEEFKKTLFRSALLRIISVICTFIFVKDVSDLYKYFIIYVFSTFSANCTLWLYLPKYIKKIKFKELKIFKHLKPAIILLIPQMALQIYTVLDKTMLGIIIEDKSEVGYYEQAQKMIKLLLTMATSLGTVMLPRVANTFAIGDKEKVIEYIKKSIQFVLFSVFPIILGMISVAGKFVPIFYGEGYDKVTILIDITIPILLVMALSNIIGTEYLVVTKRQKEYTMSVIAGAVINVCFNMIFIRLLASIGASISSVIAELVVACIQFYFVRKEIKLIDVIKMMKNYIISALIMFVISVMIGNLIINGIVSIIIQIIVSVIVYLLILLILKDKIVLEGIDLVKRKLIKSKNIEIEK